MKEQIKTVYTCDHCKKKLFMKHAMIKHEPKCPSNPVNIRACFNCDHCERVPAQVEPRAQIYQGDDLINTHVFKCKKKGTFMYPPKLEHSEYGVPEYTEVEGEEVEQGKMPLICEYRKDPFDEIAHLFKL